MFSVKCPKCGSHNIRRSGETFTGRFFRNLKYAMFLPLIFFVKKPPTFYFCLDCDFEWNVRG